MRTRNTAKKRRAHRPPPSSLLAAGLAVLALLGAAAVGLGGFESPAAMDLGTPVIGTIVLGAALGTVWRRWTRPPADRLEEISDLLLWTTATWMLYRLLAGSAQAAILLPAACTAWLAASRPPGIAGPSLAAALAMEAALTLAAGVQPPSQLAANLVGFGAATAGLLFFARSRVYRRRLRLAFNRTREETDSREYARDLGLLVDRPLEGLEAPPTGGRSTLETLDTSFKLQLEILRQALGLTTVAVLWPAAGGRELRLRAVASARRDLLPGPYPPSQGIAGALLRTGEELAVAPVPAAYNGLPYYRDTSGVGSILALRIPGEVEAAEEKPAGLLCVDRPQQENWDETASRVLRLAARKIGLEITMGRRLEEMDRDRHAIQGVCFGLQELNRGLGLATVFVASMKAIRALVQADFAAISLLEEDQHRVVHAEGREAEELIGLAFPKSEGLVGQVLKLNQPLPPGGSYRGAAPIFSRARRLANLGSLLIVPLRKEKGEPFGALIVGALESGIFTDTRRQILELIATHVAVKIDLAQAHERINNMANTDGLTGLANHRTFQHGFEIMLSRAERRQSRMCLLLCDLDHFKRINDTCGHPFGDQVLKAVASILGSAVRKVDLAARYGGEEFAILLEETDCRLGRQIAERIRKKVQALSFRHHDEQVHPTISLGMAVFPEDGGDKPLLISRADQALYHAKAMGRNRLAIWGELPEEARRRASVN